MRTPRKTFLILCAVSLSLSLGPVLRLVSAYRNDTYWTHAAMRLPLSEGARHVEIYVRGVLLQKALRQRKLLWNPGTGPEPVSDSDVSIRLNRIYEFTRWDMVLASCFGTSGLLFLGLFLFSKRKEQPETEFRRDGFS
jgi:hypothetical protein